MFGDGGRMEPVVRERLDAADDPVHAEGDPKLDWPAIHARVAALRPELERIAGRAFVQDNNVQDASFFTELSIQRPGPRPNWIDTVFAVRFSGFGLLFTTWSHCEAERPGAHRGRERKVRTNAAGSAEFTFFGPLLPD